MSRRVGVAVLLLGCASLGATRVEERDTRVMSCTQLASLCRSGDPAYDLGCLSYVRGVLEEVVSSELDRPTFCLPRRINMTATINEIRATAFDRPQLENQSARACIREAAVEAYPCAN